MHTNSRAAFARGDRLTPKALDLGTETRDVWLVVTDNRELRERLTQTPVRHIVYRLRRESDRSDPLEALDRLLIWMAAVGYPEATLRLLLAHVDSVITRCFLGNAHRSLQELDREETQLEAVENELTIARLHAGDTITPEQLEAEAVINEHEATVQLERAKELRRVARVRRRGETRVLPFPGRV